LETPSEFSRSACPWNARAWHRFCGRATKSDTDLPKTPRGEGESAMRKPVGVVLALISVLLLGATVVTYSKYKKSAADYAQATSDEQSMRQRYDGAVSEIVMIQDSLNTIVLGGESVLPETQ